MARKLQRRAMAPAWSIGVTIPARAIFHLIVVLAMLALFSGHARAGLLGDIGGFIGDVGDWVTGKDSVPGIPSDAACHGYATRATVAQSQNKQLCGFTGPRWGEDHNAHFRWCKMQNTRGEHLLGETAENEERIRDSDLARCTRCNEYENQANSAARQNRVLHCGGTGDRWGSGDGHKTWCMGVRQSTADAETNARTAAVNQCKTTKYSPAQLDECKAYANNAVKQAKFNADSICGGTGPRWTQDRDAHFAFCTWGWENRINGTNVITAMQNERDARDAENEKCQDGSVDYGGVRGRANGGSNGNQLQPIPSPGPSPFGGGNKINAGSPGASGISAVNNRDNPITALPITTRPHNPIIMLPSTRLPPPTIPVAPRESNGVPPVMTGGSTGFGGVSPAKPLPPAPMPNGSSGVPPVKSDGTTDPLAWRHKLPLDLFKPKGPSGLPPVKSEGSNRENPVGWKDKLPLDVFKPKAPNGAPPATGGNTGTGGVPAPMPKTPSGLPPFKSDGKKTDSPIVEKNKGVPLDLFKKAASGPVPFKSEGAKRESPILSKHKALLPDLIKPKASSGAPPVKSNATVGSLATKTPGLLVGGLKRLGAATGSVLAGRASTARARPSLLR